MRIIHRTDTLDIGRNRNFITSVCRHHNRYRTNPIRGPLAMFASGVGLILLIVFIAISSWQPAPRRAIEFRTQDSDVTLRTDVELHTERGVTR